MSDTINRRGLLQRLAVGIASAAGCMALAGGVAVAGGKSSPHWIRPPGALDEEDFLATCIRCGRCADACPNRAIVAFTEATGKRHSATPVGGELGTPVIFPRAQACILCNKAPGDELACGAVCPSGALRKIKKEPDAILAEVDMGTATVDTALCHSYNGASCGACVRACPFEGKALRAGLWEKPIVDPDLCVGCGLCERACLTYPQSIRIHRRA